jgi:peptidoglycan hydrolase-like protein with peptidoglycan-binding domain
MEKKDIRLIQKLLSDMDFYTGSIDGILGPKTERGLISADTSYALQGIVGMSYLDINRSAVAFLQLKCKEKHLPVGPIDGYWGPMTEACVDDLYDLTHYGEIRFEKPEFESGFPIQYSADFYEFYGPIDNVALGNVRLPFPVKIAWDPSTTITRFQANKKVAESIEAIYVDTLSVYGLEEIQRLGLDLWGGCYNKRKVRGGTKWSLHSWGIAVDIDPARNRLRWGSDKAELAKPEYDRFWNIVEKHGGVSLGREAGFDFMHFQFAKLK